MSIRSMLNNFKENTELKRQIRELTDENITLTKMNSLICFNENKVMYVRNLILQDEIINSLSHGSSGLYSEINMPFLDFITEVRVKVQNMEKQNIKSNKM